MIADIPTRRRLVTLGSAGILAAALPPCASAAPPDAGWALAAIEKDIGGWVGVAAWNTGSGAWVTRRADERFAMCSTFKLLLTAAILGLADQGATSLTRRSRTRRATRRRTRR